MGMSAGDSRAAGFDACRGRASSWMRQSRDGLVPVAVGLAFILSTILPAVIPPRAWADGGVDPAESAAFSGEPAQASPASPSLPASSPRDSLAWSIPRYRWEFPDSLPMDSTRAARRTAIKALLRATNEALKEPDYDRASKTSKEAITLSGDDIDLLGDAYIMLVNSYTQGGNFYKSEHAGQEISALFYKEAQRCVTECLSRPELRHVNLEPYRFRLPVQEMEFFRAAREQMFGSIRVEVTSPTDATVCLDGDTLAMAPGDSIFEETAVPVGTHQLRITHNKYKDRIVSVQISPGLRLDRTYALAGKRTVRWYALRASILVGGGVAYLASRSNDHNGLSPIEPAPGPPH